jgi:hypothetical protein
MPILTCIADRDGRPLVTGVWCTGEPATCGCPACTDATSPYSEHVFEWRLTLIDLRHPHYQGPASSAAIIGYDDDEVPF